jgi:hypothetical protein
LVGLKRGLERAPLLRPELVPLRGHEQARVRGLLRLPERWLQRCEGRVRLRVQMQLPERESLRQDEWR